MVKLTSPVLLAKKFSMAKSSSWFSRVSSYSDVSKSAMVSLSVSPLTVISENPQRAFVFTSNWCSSLDKTGRREGVIRTISGFPMT